MSQPVYLVRHGQSEWNLLRLTQGQTHHPRLTDLGRAQAAAAAELLVGDLSAQAPVRLLTSDLARATETAAIIGARLGVEPESDVRLREQHLGSLQGRSYDEVEPAVGGETARQVGDRMAAVLAALDRSRPTVLVSHGDAIRAAAAHLAGQRPDEAPWLEVANGAVGRVERGGLTWLRTPRPRWASPRP